MEDNTITKTDLPADLVFSETDDKLVLPNDEILAVHIVEAKSVQFKDDEPAKLSIKFLIDEADDSTMVGKSFFKTHSLYSKSGELVSGTGAKAVQLGSALGSMSPATWEGQPLQVVFKKAKHPQSGAEYQDATYMKAKKDQKVTKAPAADQVISDADLKAAGLL